MATNGHSAQPQAQEIAQTAAAVDSQSDWRDDFRDPLYVAICDALVTRSMTLVKRRGTTIFNHRTQASIAALACHLRGKLWRTPRA